MWASEAASEAAAVRPQTQKGEAASCLRGFVDKNNLPQNGTFPRHRSSESHDDDSPDVHNFWEVVFCARHVQEIVLELLIVIVLVPARLMMAA